jgi:hypothetical protein
MIGLLERKGQPSWPPLSSLTLGKKERPQKLF